MTATNVCPPYQVVGGHVCSRAIGLVNSPFHHGVDAASRCHTD